MDIKIMGSGCAKCKKLEELTRNVVDELKLQADIKKEEDFATIMEYGIVRTPALVINDKVLLSGRLPSQGELRDLLTAKE
ncbi:MAG: thioredoxin family protein [Bacteroidales bacterium]